MKRSGLFFLILAVSLFIAHEMDAMTHSEWRLLPGFGSFDDETARIVFVLSHVPLFMGLLWALFFASWKRVAIILFSCAVIVHAIAHYILSGHRLYTFEAPVETVTVYGAAATALLVLIFILKEKRDAHTSHK